jgi:sterol desaturase/sphingolipid hydroxylase (fatty acid hydroxylase superfamily)
MIEATLARFFDHWWHTLLIVGAFVLGVAIIERLRPAERGQPWRDSAFNIVYGVWSQGVYVAIVPWLTVAATEWVRGFSPGLLSPAAALSWPAKAGLALAWLFAYDLCYYAFHRAQHTWPLLWRQHLLHHSDYSVNAFTTFRHHWLEEPLKVFVVVVPMAIVFDAPPVFTGLAWLVVSGWPAFIHANMRVGFGPGHWLLTSPQTHRVHHSRLAQHHDRNYAVFFPVIDRIFGTWYEPARDEYPPTGLDTGRRIRSQFEAAFSPFMRDPAPAAGAPTDAPAGGAAPPR